MVRNGLNGSLARSRTPEKLYEKPDFDWPHQRKRAFLERMIPNHDSLTPAEFTISWPKAGFRD